jgi:hypothetical protein
MAAIGQTGCNRPEEDAMNDPIIEEVRKHRQARAAKFGFNIRAMMEDARKRQAKSGHPVVNLEGKGNATKRAAARSKFRKKNLRAGIE